MSKGRKTVGEMLRFGIVGVLSTALHYLIYRVLPLQENVGYTIGYAVSFLFNFWATSRYTFHARPTWGRLAGMGGAHASNYVLHMVLLNIFLYIGMSKAWAPLPVYAIAVPVNFLLVRFVFNSHIITDKS